MIILWNFLRSRKRNLNKEAEEEIQVKDRLLKKEIPHREAPLIKANLEDREINKGHSENYFGDYRDFWWNRNFLDMTAKRLELNTYNSMLDVGCGTGHWTRTLAPYLDQNAHITAVDSDPTWFKDNKELS